MSSLNLYGREKKQNKTLDCTLKKHYFHVMTVDVFKRLNLIVSCAYLKNYVMDEQMIPRIQQNGELSKTSVIKCHTSQTDLQHVVAHMYLPTKTWLLIAGSFQQELEKRQGYIEMNRTDKTLRINTSTSIQCMSIYTVKIIGI